MNKQFEDVKITTEHKSYADTSYAYDDNDRTLPNLVSGEQIGDSLGKIKRWIDQRKQVIIGELSDGTGIIKSQYLPSYVDDVIDCYYSDPYGDPAGNGKMYTDASKTTLLPYPSDAPQYTLLEIEPSDWSTNYTSYYTKDGNTYTPVPEGASAPTWVAETYYKHNVAGDGVKGKIYQDLAASPLPVFYRWTGTNFARTGSGDAPPIYDGGNTAGLVGPSTHLTDTDRYFLGEDGNWDNTAVLGATAATFTLLAEEPDDWGTDYTSYYTYDSTKAHNQYTLVPAGDSAPTFETNKYYTISAAVAGKTGFVPAPDVSGYTEYQNENNKFLRADGTWSNAPVIAADTLILHCKVYDD